MEPGPLQVVFIRLLKENGTESRKDSFLTPPTANDTEVCRIQFTIINEACELNNIGAQQGEYQQSCDCKQLAHRDVISGPIPLLEYLSKDHADDVKKAECKLWFVGVDTFFRMYLSMAATFDFLQYYEPCLAN